MVGSPFKKNKRLHDTVALLWELVTSEGGYLW